MTSLRLTCCALALLSLAGNAWAADAKKGATVFNRCTVCHSNTKGAPARIGPNLFGIVGRKAGTAPGYDYSAAMKNSGLVWNDDQLKKYVAHPQQVVPGTKMAFAGIPNATDADDLIAYLNTLK